MKATKIIMGMPITVEIAEEADKDSLNQVFDYFKQVDARYSTYKKTSEISQINRGLPKARWSGEMKEVLKLCEQTKQQTNGYFDIKRGDKLDPSGLVKGWAINNASIMLNNMGFNNYYIEAGGDIQAEGNSADGLPWRVGVRSPFRLSDVVKVVSISGQGIATSGAYIRGEHIYDPHERYQKPNPVRSLTVIGPNIYEADRFATAAFAMGPSGVEFIDSLDGFEAYMVDEHKMATFTPGFERYVADNN